jgi:hypothetical protein
MITVAGNALDSEPAPLYDKHSNQKGRGMKNEFKYC